MPGRVLSEVQRFKLAIEARSSLWRSILRRLAYACCFGFAITIALTIASVIVVRADAVRGIAACDMPWPGWVGWRTRGFAIQTSWAMSDEMRFQRQRIEAVKQDLPGWSVVATSPPAPPNVTPGVWFWEEAGRGWPAPAFRSIDIVAPDGTWTVREGIRIGGSPKQKPFRIVPTHPLWIGIAIDTCFWGVASLVIVIGLRLAARRLRLHRGRCPTCGYDLRDDFSQGCPECGWRREANAGGTS